MAPSTRPSSEPDTFTFNCSDKKTFAIPLRFADKFGVIQSILMDSTCEGGEDILETLQPMKVECCSGTLAKVLEWLEHHEHDQEPIGDGIIDSGDVMTDDTIEGPTGWDKHFLDSLGCIDFYRLVVTTVDMEISGLLTIIRREMATRLKSPPDQLAKALQVDDIAEFLKQNPIRPR